MENAVQALLIAAGALLAVAILSLAVSLYTTLGGYVDNAEQDILNSEIAKFNEKFTRYINCDTFSSDVEFILTIQDIVTAANVAHESNLEYGLTEQSSTNYYVIVKLDGHSLEKDINTKTSQILEQGLGHEYKCSRSETRINTETGRVFEVNFKKIT